MWLWVTKACAKIRYIQRYRILQNVRRSQDMKLSWKGVLIVNREKKSWHFCFWCINWNSSSLGQEQRAGLNMLAKSRTAGDSNAAFPMQVSKDNHQQQQQQIGLQQHKRVTQCLSNMLLFAGGWEYFQRKFRIIGMKLTTGRITI